MMNLGPHVGFIVSAYIAAIAIVAGLVAWIMFERWHLTRMLDEFGAQRFRGPVRALARVLLVWNDGVCNEATSSLLKVARRRIECKVHVSAVRAGTRCR